MSLNEDFKNDWQRKYLEGLEENKKRMNEIDDKITKQIEYFVTKGDFQRFEAGYAEQVNTLTEEYISLGKENHTDYMKSADVFVVVLKELKASNIKIMLSTFIGGTSLGGALLYAFQYLY